MAIQIKYQAGVYEIKGLLNSQNIESLNNHQELLIEHSTGIVLSLNKLVDIDSNAVNETVCLQNKYWLSDKMFYIIWNEK
jgi:hypothetical protein